MSKTFILTSNTKKVTKIRVDFEDLINLVHDKICETCDCSTNCPLAPSSSCGTKALKDRLRTGEIELEMELEQDLIISESIQ